MDDGGIGRYWRCATLVVVLVIMAGTFSSAGVQLSYKAHISEPTMRLDPSPNGSPAWARFDTNGNNLLLWGHEGPNDIRVLGRDLATRKVLDLPSPGFTVKGVEWCDSQDVIVAWGRAPGDPNDTLVFYEAPGWSIGDGLVPGDMLPLVEIDFTLVYANNLILTAAGRDVNGTNRVLVVETGPDSILRDDPVMGNRSVVSIENDGRFMIMLDDEGGLTVYSTQDWTILRSTDLLSAPFSSHFVELGNIQRVFGGQDGTIACQVEMDKDEWETFITGTDPVLGVWVTDPGDRPGYIVAATPKDGSSSTLQIWEPLDGANWSRHWRSKIEGRVSMLAMDPTSNTTVVIAFQDGSVAMCQLIVERYEKIPSDWWVPYVGIGLFIVVVLVVVFFLFSRRKGRAEEPAATGDAKE